MTPWHGQPPPGNWASSASKPLDSTAETGPPNWSPRQMAAATAMGNSPGKRAGLAGRRGGGGGENISAEDGSSSCQSRAGCMAGCSGGVGKADKYCMCVQYRKGRSVSSGLAWAETLLHASVA